jgi:hypothetical protein
LELSPNSSKLPSVSEFLNHLDLKEKDCAITQFNLAYSYENGFGIEKSLEKAFYWYQKAAEKDYAIAQAYQLREHNGEIINTPVNGCYLKLYKDRAVWRSTSQQ